MLFTLGVSPRSLQLWKIRLWPCLRSPESFMARLWERWKRRFGAIAYRAYELFEARGGDHGHDLEDWFRAEKELVKPGNIQTMDSGGQIKVHASVPGFTGDEIQIGIAPTRLII